MGVRKYENNYLLKNYIKYAFGENYIYRLSGFWGRIVRGDSIECVMDRPEDAFEVA